MVGERYRRVWREDRNYTVTQFKIKMKTKKSKKLK